MIHLNKFLVQGKIKDESHLNHSKLTEFPNVTDARMIVLEYEELEPHSVVKVPEIPA